MNIVPPTPEVTQGPEWAEDINTILTTTIAEHNHQSPNGGVALTQDALAIDGDLSLNGNQLTNANAIGLQTLTGSASGSNRLYNDSGDLYYKDGNGTSVRITQNGSLSAASFGGISGLSGTSGTATFAGLSTFEWKKDVGEYASMENADITIYSKNDTNPAGGVVLSAPDSMAANTTLILPNQLPAGAGQSFLVLSGSGLITGSVSLNQGIVDSMIASGTIATNKFAAANFVTSSEQDAFSVIATSTYSDVPLLSGTITTTGRPLHIVLGSPVESEGTFLVLVDGSGSNTPLICVNISGTVASGINYNRMVYGFPNTPASAFTAHSQAPMVGLFNLPSDTYTIKVKAKKVSGAVTQFDIFNAQLSIMEV